MEKYIIFIIVLFIIILLYLILNNGNCKEELTLTYDQKKKIGNNLKYFLINSENINIPKADISGNIKEGNNKFNLEDMIKNFKYPVGSYYVQYPDRDELTRTTATFSDVFPVEKSPEYLFGGKWLNVWNDESIYFRTGIMTNTYSGAYEINDGTNTRILGLQDYAIPKMTGRTGWMQGNDDKLGSNQYDITGVFNAGNTFNDGSDNVDDGAAWKPGAINTFDTKFVFPGNTSEYEVRVKNRLMKIWKRIS